MNTQETSPLDIDATASSGNYVLAILVGFIGAIVGTIPFVVVGIFSEYVIGWLVVLVPFAAVQAFIRFYKAPDKNIPSIIILNLISIVTILASCFFLQIFVGAMDPDIAEVAAMLDVNAFMFTLEFVLELDLEDIITEFFVPLALPMAIAIGYGGIVLIPSAIKGASK